MLLTNLHIPSAQQNLVHNPELHEKLNLALSLKRFRFSDPNGYGKIFLLNEWINQQKLSTSWISPGNYDNNQVDFSGCIIAAIQDIKNEIRQSIFKLLNSPNKSYDKGIVSLFFKKNLNLSNTFLLITDDFLLSESE